MSAVFLAMLRAAGLPEPVTEHRFHPTRKWRFDYAWPAQKVALEVEGAVWTNGRHTRGSGFVKDMEKYNSAAVLGWMVLRVQTKELTNGAAVQWVEDGLYERTKNS
jgi:very-short-patch-repair endonuclease